MLANLSYLTTLVAVTCPTCGIPHGIPNEFKQWKLEHPGEALSCPNGHSWYYTGKTEAQKLKEENDRLTAARDAARRDADWQRDQRKSEERKRIALKGVMTKLKKRVGSGICPCCRRSFSALTAHMKTKHPEYAQTEG